MLQFVIKKLPFGGGGDPPKREEQDSGSSGEEEDFIEEYPQYVPQPTSLPGLASKEGFDTTKVGEQQAPEEDDAREVIKTTGVVTRLDESMPKGVIDRTYFFDIGTFCNGSHPFKLQSVVDFEAFRSKSCPAWVVTSMKIHVTQKEEELKETRRHRTLTVQVSNVYPDGIEVKWGDEKYQKLPKLKDIMPEYSIKQGDWLKVHFEQMYDKEQAERDAGNLHSDETLGKIVSIEPNRQKTMVGKITKKGNEYCIDDEIYATMDVIKGARQIPLNTLVRCVAVDSTQKVYGGEFQWRAVEVTMSNFLKYTSDPHNRDEEEFFVVEEEDISARYRDLYQNRGGIQIKPTSYVKFPPAKVGTCVSSKSITIQNISNRAIMLHKIVFPHDSTVCKFELDAPVRERDAIRNLAPDETFTMKVLCTPLQMGRTKELGVFDFGEFKIARDFIVLGLPADDELMKKIRNPENGHVRQMYHRIRGDELVGAVIRDNNRVRIRGVAPIRAPFFMANRIPRYQIPNEIWEAFQQKSESKVRTHFSGALEPLSFRNYQVKFQVSLWFEEVDNDIRRRQYDLAGVRFKKAHDGMYSFDVPHLPDIQPQVLMGDPIDAFDPEDTNAVKYQGFIKKISGTEVYVGFSETFNNTYGGAPLTVRFCLGRMTYKRQHYAVELAMKRLGEDFLFPFDFLEVPVQEPRIPFYEDDDAADSAINAAAEAMAIAGRQGQNPVVHQVEPSQEVEMAGASLLALGLQNESKLFQSREEKEREQTRQQLSPRKLPFALQQQQKMSKNKTLIHQSNKRATSLRSPMVSDAPTSKFLKDVRLRWFNTELNEEQKNAVRRILRGQARPLPYIIFGPPGTGKTVTVVEAIMQVNKLDPNSRVLVTAPTNHAADVIAEHLVKSQQYHPGEFLRFNGFMRQEQVVLDSIKEYCVDGEFLDSVVRNRLIIATCATAGQFFSLNLAPGHFTHVFVDEAGYCTEPEVMISAVNLAIEKGGQLILAGDPNQLGPVLMSDVAQNLLLNLSYLERLMTGKKAVPNTYARNPEKFGSNNSGYNALVLTKLVKNYRAHSSLLKLPSRLFYDDDLIPCASHEEAYALTQDPDICKHVLLTQGVPIVFHGVQGTSVRERDSPSWYNAAEVMQVVSYVRKLKLCGIKNDDIGIITMYRKQVEKLRVAMQLSFLEDETPKIGSIEEFQGGERQVVIISTVRSLFEDKIETQIDKFGFIYNAKRFNVAITRAKSLMIIVGNPHVLWKDKKWNDLLRYCLELRAYTGCNLPLELDQVAKQLYRKFKEEEESASPETLPPHLPTSNYNPDGLDEDEFEDALA